MLKLMGRTAEDLAILRYQELLRTSGQKTQ
jgi:hypothetical protein